MDPKVCGKLLRTHRRGLGVDIEALHGWFPLRRSLRRLQDGISRIQKVAAVELGFWLPVLIVQGYVGIYGRKKYVGGSPGCPRGRGARPGGWGCPPPAWAARDSPGPTSILHGMSSGPNKILKKFRCAWTLFDIDFLRKNMQKTTTSIGHYVNRLVPKNVIKWL